MSEVVGIWFPKTRETTVRSYKNGERKEYAMIYLKEKKGYENYSIIWPKEKVKTDWNHKGRRCFFAGKDHILTARKYEKNDEGKRELVDEFSITARELSEIMKQWAKPES